jgi:hypothetical protein
VNNPRIKEAKILKMTIAGKEDLQISGGCLVYVYITFIRFELSSFSICLYGRKSKNLLEQEDIILGGGGL